MCLGLRDNRGVYLSERMQRLAATSTCHLQHSADRHEPEICGRLIARGDHANFEFDSNDGVHIYSNQTYHVSLVVRRLAQRNIAAPRERPPKTMARAAFAVVAVSSVKTLNGGSDTVGAGAARTTPTGMTRWRGSPPWLWGSPFSSSPLLY